MVQGCSLHCVDDRKGFKRRRVSPSAYPLLDTRQMKLPRLLQPLSARAVCGSKQAGGARRWRGEGITHREALP